MKERYRGGEMELVAALRAVGGGRGSPTLWSPTYPRCQANRCQRGEDDLGVGVWLGFMER